jgi:hypothetical protein
MLVLADCYSYNLATLFKVLSQLLLVRRKVHVFDEHAAAVRVILRDCVTVLPVMQRVRFRVIFV